MDNNTFYTIIGAVVGIALYQMYQHFSFLRAEKKRKKEEDMKQRELVILRLSSEVKAVKSLLGEMQKERELKETQLLTEELKDVANNAPY